ncbi:MAG: RyR domain-containing protein [Pseudomonadota bacterium]
MMPPDPATQEAVAQTVHAALRAWSRAHGQTDLPPWSRAPKWMRESTRESVAYVLANPGAGPGGQHAQWMDQKVRDGWRRGPVKDAERKTHPMLVPFAELPAFERAKDRLLIAIVTSLTA